MSKVFDCMYRNKRIEDLQNNIEADEIYIISKLLNVSLSVRCEDAPSEVFKTDTGASQGVCSSAFEFTCYLAKIL